MNKISTAAQVLERLRIGASTLGRWCAESRAGIGTFPLPVSEPGKQRRWLASSIDAWLERQQATPQPPPVSPTKQNRRLEEQRAVTQKILEKHYPHRKAKRNS
jgi:predicted DNA-binding transcriptional regulator AlpA